MLKAHLRAGLVVLSVLGAAAATMPACGSTTAPSFADNCTTFCKNVTLAGCGQNESCLSGCLDTSGLPASCVASAQSYLACAAASPVTTCPGGKISVVGCDTVQAELTLCAKGDATTTVTISVPAISPFVGVLPSGVPGSCVGDTYVVEDALDGLCSNGLVYLICSDETFSYYTCTYPNGYVLASTLDTDAGEDTGVDAGEDTGVDAGVDAGEDADAGCGDLGASCTADGQCCGAYLCGTDGTCDDSSSGDSSSWG